MLNFLILFYRLHIFLAFYINLINYEFSKKRYLCINQFKAR